MSYYEILQEILHRFDNGQISEAQFRDAMINWIRVCGSDDLDCFCAELLDGIANDA